MFLLLRHKWLGDGELPRIAEEMEERRRVENVEWAGEWS